MGDVLLATMLVRELRTQFPDARIDVCVNEEWSDIFRYNPHCSSVHAYKRSFSRAEFSRWKKGIQQSLQETTGNTRYDWILDLQRNNRSRRIRSGLGKNVRRIKKLQVQYHLNVPDAVEKRQSLRSRLAQTHRELYCYPFVWEAWELLPY